MNYVKFLELGLFCLQEEEKKQKLKSMLYNQ